MPEAESIRVEDCRLSSRVESARDTAQKGQQAGRVDGAAPGMARIQVNCPVRAIFPERTHPKFTKLEFPKDVGVTLTADLRALELIPSMEETVRGTAQAELVDLATPILQGGGGIRAEFSGIPVKFPNDWTMEVETGLRLEIESFQELVDALRGTAYAVPAPLNVFVGDVRFSTRGSADLKGGVFPVSFETEMASKHQALKILSDGDLKLRDLKGTPSAHLDLEVELSDVRLSLPRLDLRAPPRMLPDSRIKDLSKPEESPGGPSAFTYSIRVRTPDGRPVELLSNLTKGPIPVQLDLVSTAEKAAVGAIRIGNFPVRFFGREATVERFVLSLPEQGPQTVDGLVKVKYGDYTIRVLVLGTAEKPQIQFQSDPPLPEDQIVSVLLFGQTTEELDPEQSETVGNFKSAVAGRAVSLLSLSLLASTPIQSVGFDPTTGRLSAKIRLGEGTSLNLGAAAGESGSVGVQKRLGPHWTISTEVLQPVRNREPTYSAFLEWINRY